jgi:hypothetical protein
MHYVPGSIFKALWLLLHATLDGYLVTTDKTRTPLPTRKTSFQLTRRKHIQSDKGTVLSGIQYSTWARLISPHAQSSKANTVHGGRSLVGKPWISLTRRRWLPCSDLRMLLVFRQLLKGSILDTNTYLHRGIICMDPSKPNQFRQTQHHIQRFCSTQPDIFNPRQNIIPSVWEVDLAGLGWVDGK